MNMKMVVLIHCDKHTIHPKRQTHSSRFHDDVVKWKHFPRYWPFVRGITGLLWIPHTKASDAELWCFLELNKRLSKQSWGLVRRYHAHYDVTVMLQCCLGEGPCLFCTPIQDCSIGSGTISANQQRGILWVEFWFHGHNKTSKIVCIFTSDTAVLTEYVK